MASILPQETERNITLSPHKNRNKEFGPPSWTNLAGANIHTHTDRTRSAHGEVKPQATTCETSKSERSPPGPGEEGSHAQRGASGLEDQMVPGNPPKHLRGTKTPV